MNTIIRNVFLNPEQVEKKVEMVIGYKVNSQANLKTEIQEYVVTEHISQNLEKVLEWIEQSMNGNLSETGAWVSGFYGSGKSSFTKYLGCAFDQDILIDGRPFADYLADQIEKKDVRQRLKTLTKRFNATVIMLDLATENTRVGKLPVSDTLLAHVRRWAGYSGFELIAEFEEHVRADGRWEELLEICPRWEEYHNQSIAAKPQAKEIAQQMYPEVAFDFNSKDHLDLSVREKVQKILKIIRQKTACANILFVIDEVGQYVGNNQNFILDMQGIAESLRDCNFEGGGQCTAHSNCSADADRYE